jgi:hypothetical protein
MVEKIDVSEWPEIVYRFSVSKGIRTVIIRMDSNGNMVQARNINE